MPWDKNSRELVQRYRALGGAAGLEIYQGRGHGPSGEGGGDPSLKDDIFYRSKRGGDFLLE